MADLYWITLDGRKIPLRYMTTTHVGNAMYHQSRVMGEVYPPLLEEWNRREKEGIIAKAIRFAGRVLGNYYKGTAKYGKPQKEKFKKLNDKLAAENQRFINAVEEANDGNYGFDPEDFQADKS